MRLQPSKVNRAESASGIEPRRCRSRPWPGLAGRCLIADQCPGPIGFQLTKLFGSRPARRDFTISLARWVPTSATRFRQAGVSASKAIWSSVSLSSSASEYGVLRSLLGLSQDGSELFEDSSSMSCPVPLLQSHIACWRRSVPLSTYCMAMVFPKAAIVAAIVLSTNGRCDLIPTVVDEMGQLRPNASTRMVRRTSGSHQLNPAVAFRDEH